MFLDVGLFNYVFKTLLIIVIKYSHASSTFFYLIYSYLLENRIQSLFIR